MERVTRSKALLIELVLTALFLAISSTVIARLFLLAHATAEKSRLMNRATSEAQNWAERLCAADDREAMLLDRGFTAADAGYILKTDFGLFVEISLENQKTDRGLIADAIISVSRESETLIEIAQKGYVPGQRD